MILSEVIVRLGSCRFLDYACYTCTHEGSSSSIDQVEVLQRNYMSDLFIWSASLSISR